jgi:hypothetical protein
MIASKNLCSTPNATDLNQHDGFIPTQSCAFFSVLYFLSFFGVWFYFEGRNQFSDLSLGAKKSFAQFISLALQIGRILCASGHMKLLLH